jgi:hypothetical protein
MISTFCIRVNYLISFLSYTIHCLKIDVERIIRESLISSTFIFLWRPNTLGQHIVMDFFLKALRIWNFNQLNLLISWWAVVTCVQVLFLVFPKWNWYIYMNLAGKTKAQCLIALNKRKISLLNSRNEIFWLVLRNTKHRRISKY